MKAKKWYRFTDEFMIFVDELVDEVFGSKSELAVCMKKCLNAADIKAVKEHDEQIDNLRDDFNVLESDLDDFKKRYFNDKQEFQEQLDKDFDDVYTEFSNVKDTVNDINMGYIKWSAEVSQFNERIEKIKELTKNTECIAVNTNCLCGQLEKKVDKFDERIEKIEKRLDDYKEAYMHLDNADEAFDRRIKILEGNMKELAMNGGLGLSFNLMNARISDNKHSIAEITRRLDILEASIHKLEEGFCEVADDTTLNTSVNENLDEKVAKLEDDLLENTKVIADLAENNIKNRQLETRLDAILSKNNSEYRSLKKRLESDEEIFDSQSNRINKMQDDINAAHQNLVHQADRINANITSLIDLESRVKTLENASKKATKKND